MSKCNNTVNTTSVLGGIKDILYHNTNDNIFERNFVGIFEID